ncbi:DnaJ (Hsp40) homolog, subfamily C, member 8, isoform CRA_c [Rattus norvegicus]|uniref:DnaJ (Hsp40) homolog, subfamily C, member 8, isoform CRA_c n=1 Tax=Rattus norvegicus TaxID=10116 RepID=A6ISU2_RAT|nr:DnaJ (Hsp40) homolog, subfamily C, member 8, isoform CRA_c [Rattus norvegicus]
MVEWTVGEISRQIQRARRRRRIGPSCGHRKIGRSS